MCSPIYRKYIVLLERPEEVYKHVDRSRKLSIWGNVEYARIVFLGTEMTKTEFKCLTLWVAEISWKTRFSLAQRWINRKHRYKVIRRVRGEMRKNFFKGWVRFGNHCLKGYVDTLINFYEYLALYLNSYELQDHRPPIWIWHRPDSSFLN